MKQYRSEPGFNQPLVPPVEGLTRAGGLTLKAAGELLEAAHRDPEAYWSQIARELEWRTPWIHTLDGGFPRFRYFSGGVSNVSVNCIDRWAAIRPNQVAIYWEREDGARERLTFLELAHQTARLANALKRLGVGRSDRVAIYLSNIPEAWIAVHACYRIGAIYSIIFAGFSAHAVHQRLADAQPKVVITANASLRHGHPVPLKATLEKALKGVDSVERIIMTHRVDVDVPHTERDLDWHECLAAECPVCPPEPMEANEPGFIIYTSGTSAQPKGLVHAGMGFLVGVYANVKWSLALTPQDIYWCTADIGWLAMPVFATVGGLAHGASHVLYEGALDWPDPGRLYRMIEAYGITKLFAAPTVLRMLRRSGDQHLHGIDLDSLRLILLAGEPLDPETWWWIHDVLGSGHVFLNNTYGQTETGTAWTSSMVGLTATRPGSCGHPLPGYQARVLDEQDRSVSTGQVGDLVLSAPFPSLARDIWGDSERYVKTYFSTHAGHYHSSDAAFIDADGMVWVTGRTDDVINVSAHRLGTMELEAALLNHPAVGEAAVVGAYDPVKGMVPVAFVVLRMGYEPGSTLGAELEVAVTTAAGRYARPRRIVFTSTLPRTRSGKIMRRLLRELLDQGHIQSDITALDNPDAIDTLDKILKRSVYSKDDNSCNNQ